MLFCNGLAAQSFDEAVDSLSAIMTAAAKDSSYEAKHVYLKSFAELLEKTLKQPKSLYHLFDSVPGMKVIASKDGIVRVFCWGEPLENGEYKYRAILQRRMGGTDSPLSDIYVLEDVGKTLNNPEGEVLHCPEWYGCLYYDIVEKQEGDKTFYTLMGFNFNNLISYKKCIDILTFNAQGVPSFGAPLFVEEKGRAKCRIILEYSSKAKVYLKYNNKVGKIVFNALHPIVPEKRYDKAFYVPDLVYDGYEFKYGKWTMVRNVLLIKE
jgi:hypothetical protein